VFDYPGVVSVAVLPKCGVKAVWFQINSLLYFFSHYISLPYSAAAKVASVNVTNSESFLAGPAEFSFGRIWVHTPPGSAVNGG
jgi:hypothetical protein